LSTVSVADLGGARVGARVAVVAVADIVNESLWLIASVNITEQVAVPVAVGVLKPAPLLNAGVGVVAVVGRLRPGALRPGAGQGGAVLLHQAGAIAILVAVPGLGVGPARLVAEPVAVGVDELTQGRGPRRDPGVAVVAVAAHVRQTHGLSAGDHPLFAAVAIAVGVEVALHLAHRWIAVVTVFGAGDAVLIEIEAGLQLGG